MQVWEKEPLVCVGDAGRDTRGMDVILRVAEVNEEVGAETLAQLHAHVYCDNPYLQFTFNINLDLLSAQDTYWLHK